MNQGTDKPMRISKTLLPIELLTAMSAMPYIKSIDRWMLGPSTQLQVVSVSKVGVWVEKGGGREREGGGNRLEGGGQMAR